MQIYRHRSPIGGKCDVFIAVPAYGQNPTGMMFSLWCAKDLLDKEGISVELMVLAGGCHVDDMRNFLAVSFLESDCRKMVFIDNDTYFQPEDLVTLIHSEFPLVAGVCPKKSDDLSFAYRPIPNRKYINNSIFEVDGVGTAFMKIDRCVIEKLSETKPKYKLDVEGKPYSVPLIFERTIDETGNRYGGDISFCREWKKAGGRVFVLPEMNLGHIGEKRWDGMLGKNLREINKSTPEYIAKIISDHKNKLFQEKDLKLLSLEWGNTNWSTSVDTLSILNLLAIETQGNILELGSGVSTLVLAASGKKVETIEHDRVFADKVLSVSELAGTDITLYDAEIKHGWYNVEIDSPETTLVYIDGPPRWLSDRSIAIDRISVSDDCIFVIDDFEEFDLDKLAYKFGLSITEHGRCAIGKKI